MAPKLCALRQAGVVTPDHTIRTKNWPLLLPAPEAGKLEISPRRRASGRRNSSSAIADYFARNNASASAASKRMLDPLPRVALVPGLGLFGLGRTKKDAVIAADLAETCDRRPSPMREAIGRFESISEADMFDMEYWSLEQAKLGTAEENAARRPDRRRDRRRRRHRGRDRQGVCGGRRRGRAARSRCRSRAGPGQYDRRARRLRSPAT